MRPLTWIERLLWLLSPFRRLQCKATLPFKHCGGVACCIRWMGHPGQHETYNGESFPTTESTYMNKGGK